MPKSSSLYTHTTWKVDLNCVKTHLRATLVSIEQVNKTAILKLNISIKLKGRLHIIATKMKTPLQAALLSLFFLMTAITTYGKVA